jgi:biotin carboxylase
MERLGDKVSSKEVARACGIPVIEDNHQKLVDSSVVLQEATRIGFP